MWVWRKLSSVKWTDAWEERFYGDERSVMTELKGGKTIRLEVYRDGEEEVLDLQRRFGGEVRVVKNRDWVTKSKPGPPRRLAAGIWLTQQELEQLPGSDQEGLVISIPGELAFGTGDHFTTDSVAKLVVEALRSASPPHKVLDLGTGTGILAILAEKLGAETVHGIDFDDDAITVAKRNLARNDCERVTLQTADVLTWSATSQYDLITANLFSSVLVQALPLVKDWLNPRGRLFLSGILIEQRKEVEQAAQACGFRVRTEATNGKWVTLGLSET